MRQKMIQPLEITVLTLCVFMLLPRMGLGGFEGQLDRPEFPIISNCQKERISLVFISDAASTDYPSHLELLTNIVDFFSDGREKQELLSISMAVSGADNEGKPKISWPIRFGSHIDASDAKGAIMRDKGRNRSSGSFLKQAVHFVDEYIYDMSYKAQSKEYVSHELSQNEEIVNRTISSFITEDNATVEETNSTQRDNVQNTVLRPSTLFVVLANPYLQSHNDNDPDLDRLKYAKSLLIVFVYPKSNFRRNTLCTAFTKHPCINLLVESMLFDHSISLALCGRCLRGWFGPMPSFNLSESSIHALNKSALSYVSCYSLVPTDHPDNYALNALEKCMDAGAALVSIETTMEFKFLDTELRQICTWKEECPGNLTSVFIGLQRNSQSLGKRFRWVNGRPLIYREWLADHPRGGYTHGCARWDLKLEGWVDIGCGHWMADTAALCEWTTPKKFEPPYVAPPAPPRDTSIQRALTSGQVAICSLHLWENILMPSVYTYDAQGCSWHINNTGVLHVINMPIGKDLIFSCEGELYGSVLYSSLCNQEKECFNNGDESEEVCGAQQFSNPDVFSCSSSDKEVPLKSQCDLYDDCLDGSDEKNCDSCQFGLCADGRCVPQSWLIDGEKDCLAMDSEIKRDIDNSVNAQKDCAFLCNRSECVPLSKLGDGVIDCLGPEGPLDETLGAMETFDCRDPHSKEWAPKCVYQKDRLGELIGCRNMRHLHECEDFQCMDGYVKCPGAYCVPVHYLYDNEIDCPFGEDEPMQLYIPNFLSGYFKCFLDGPGFIHPDRVCDGSKDCPDGTDEMGCNVTCASGFLCIAGFVVTDDYDVSMPLTNISFVDSRTRMIDFSNVNVSLAIPNMCSLDLHYLIDLRLSNCSLNDLTVSHRCLPRLLTLDMSYNLFVNISAENSNRKPLYYGATKLSFLNLSHNALLEFFDVKTLVSNYDITVLDLSYTALTTFIEMDYMTLGLRYLNLSFTRITRLASLTFPLDTIKPWRLKSLDLRGNEFSDIEPDAFKGLEILYSIHSDYFKVCCPQIRGEGIPAHTCFARDDPLSSCSHLIENKLLRILVWIMGVASLVGNSSVIITRLISGRTTLKMPYAQLVTQLGVSDILMGVYLLIIAANDVHLDGEYVLHEKSWRRSGLCKTAGFLSTLSSEVSSLFILLITVDRYLVIKYPFGQHRLTQRGILASSIFAWVLGFTLAAVPLLPWTKNWKVYSSNALCLGLPLLPEKQAGWQFSTIVFIAFNCFLCICIALGQLAIYTSASVTRDKAPTSGSTNSGDELSPRMKQDLALARRLAAVAFTDLLCWVPIGILGLLALDGRNLGSEAYAWMAVFVMPVNSALNPILYSLPTIRDNLKKAFAKCLASRKNKRLNSDEDTGSSRI